VDDRKWWIKTRTPEAREILGRVKVATRLSSELSTLCYDEPEQIRGVFEELVGKPVDDSLSLIPPFYTDYGLNITVGRKVHIGYECMFTGHAPIDIADDVMIANKTNLVTSGHPVPPDQRRDYLTGAPITIEANAWIGTATTILPGVPSEPAPSSRPVPSSPTMSLRRLLSQAFPRPSSGSLSRPRPH
jgi:acetyltransferase-like isoleucine patch superfamily enzyme